MQAAAAIGYKARDQRAVATVPPEPGQAALTAMADEDLLRLCAAGKQPALEELVRRYQAPLHRYLTRFLGSHEDAEDHTLEVFVRAWQHAGRFQFRARVSTWLYRIAANIARDAHSRKKSHPQEPWPEQHQLAGMALGSAEDDALHGLEQQRKADVLKAALARLSPADRTVLVLYYLEEREYEEIQAITGMSSTVLKTRLARARKRLRTIMERLEAKAAQ